MSHYEDEAQVEQLRHWWRENWMALAGGLVLGLAGIFGWEQWQQARTAKSEKASQIYEDMKKMPPDKVVQAGALGETLIRDYPGTPYAAQAALLMASRSVEQNDFEQARQKLDWVVQHTDDPSLKKLARLRLARVLWELQKPDDALGQLDVADDDPFAALYQELRGDIQLGKGDRAAAKTAYEKALTLNPAPTSRDGLQRKIDDLAGTPS